MVNALFVCFKGVAVIPKTALWRHLVFHPSGNRTTNSSETNVQICWETDRWKDLTFFKTSPLLLHWRRSTGVGICRLQTPNRRRTRTHAPQFAHAHSERGLPFNPVGRNGILPHPPPVWTAMDSMPVVFAFACGASTWCVCGVRACAFGSRASHPQVSEEGLTWHPRTSALFAGGLFKKNPKCWDYCWGGCFGVVDNQMLPPHLYVTFQ